MDRAVMLMGGGFLLSVLWFDLKFDVLALDALTNDGAVSAASIETIRTYYRQALSTEGNGFPLIQMNMLAAIAGALTHAYRGPFLWSRIALPVLVIFPVVYAGQRIIPMAGRLAFDDHSLVEQNVLAKTILMDHLLCFGCIAAFLLANLISFCQGNHRSSS
jgi:hypothetical protein